MVVRSVARLLCTGALLAETGVNILAWAPLADKHCVAFLGHGAGAVYTEGGRLMLDDETLSPDQHYARG
jgi:hypothetical protein